MCIVWLQQVLTSLSLYNMRAKTTAADGQKWSTLVPLGMFFNEYNLMVMLQGATDSERWSYRAIIILEL